MWNRYVAIGDSTVEGLDDPRPPPDGGYRGWADLLAERLAGDQPTLHYANLAVRGRRLEGVIDEQLPVALALEPDLVAAVAGLNDVLARSFSSARVDEQLSHLFSALGAAGATVITFTMPDPGDALPLARLARGRLLALNDATRRAASAHGAICVDLARQPVASDPRLWSEDRLHANTLGHTRVAAALADALGVPGSDSSWTDPLPDEGTRGRADALRAELTWARRHLLPWLGRHARGRSSGDGVQPKRPELLPVRGDDGA